MSGCCRDDQIAAVAEHLGDYSLLGSGPKLFGYRVGSAEVHNTYLAVLIETGIIGATLFLAWLMHVIAIGFSSLQTCRLPRARLLIAACLVGLATLLVYGLFIHGLRQRNLWMIAGLIVAVPGILRVGREATVPVEEAAILRLRLSNSHFQCGPVGDEHFFVGMPIIRDKATFY